MLRRTTRQWPAVALTALLVACTGPTAATETPTELLPADQVVFRVTSAGGLLPHLLALMESPSLVIYGDGRVLTQVSPSGNPTTPARFELSQGDPLAVAGFVARAEAQGMVDASTDVGRPGVTDMGATRVLLHGDQGESQVSAYAFDPQFETDLTLRQRSNRAALRSLIEEAEGLAGRDSATFSPDQVTVFELAPESRTPAATAVWPGPDPDSFLSPTKGRAIACGHLSGERAGPAYQAALENPGARWLVDGAERILVVNPLPATDAC